MSGGNNTTALANELYIGLTDVMTGIIGNTSTTKDTKWKMIAKVSDEFLYNHVRVVEQLVKMTEDIMLKNTIVDDISYVYNI